MSEQSFYVAYHFTQRDTNGFGFGWCRSNAAPTSVAAIKAITAQIMEGSPKIDSLIIVNHWPMEPA